MFTIYFMYMYCNLCCRVINLCENKTIILCDNVFCYLTVINLLLNKVQQNLVNQEGNCAWIILLVAFVERSTSQQHDQ